MNSSQPGLVETQLQAWNYPRASAAMAEGTELGEGSSRCPASSMGLQSDPTILARLLLMVT